MNEKVILTEKQTQAIIERLTFELIENHGDFSETVIIGLQPRGIRLANRIKDLLENKHNIANLKFAYLDTTFFRDDIRHKELTNINETKMDFLIEDKNVILIDDVLYTGRSIRAAMSTLQSFGRPKKIKLLILIDRKFSRELPIQADFIGFKVDTVNDQKVNLNWDKIYPIVYIQKN